MVLISPTLSQMTHYLQRTHCNSHTADYKSKAPVGTEHILLSKVTTTNTKTIIIAIKTLLSEENQKHISVIVYD